MDKNNTRISLDRSKTEQTRIMDTGIAQIIIDDFEENPPIPTSTDDLER